MTETHDDTIEAPTIAGIVPMTQEKPRFERHNDFDDADETLSGGSGSDVADSAEDELTPNDIFGLDPLDVLTLEELADYLKVSAAAAHRVIKEQKLPGRNIGGEWRFLRDAVANWLRGQEAPVLQQQKAREDYSKPKAAPVQENDSERYTRPPQPQRTSYQAERPEGGEYRPRQRFPEGGQQYGNQRGGQYGNRDGQYGGGQYGGVQSGGQSRGTGQYGSGNYGNSGGTGGEYTPPPRRPFRSTEGGGQGNYGSPAEGGGGYGADNAGGARFGGGGYVAGGSQRFSGGPKRKNKRQVFDNERGKRLDRRKEGDASEGSE